MRRGLQQAARILTRVINRFIQQKAPPSKDAGAFLLATGTLIRIAVRIIWSRYFVSLFQ